MEELWEHRKCKGPLETNIWGKKPDRPENSGNWVGSEDLGENDGVDFRSSWNDGMQKLEIIWKKAEKVQAEAIASKFEINGKDKKKSSMKEGKFD